MSLITNANIFRNICFLRNSSLLKASMRDSTKNSYNYSLLLIVAVIFIIIIIFLCMEIVHKNKKIDTISKELNSQNLYNKTLSSLNDNLRCFKHDFNNIVQSIGGYISLGDIDGLKLYYRKLFDDCKETNDLANLNPNRINNPSIYSLLVNKYFLAKDKGLDIVINVITDLDTINFNIYKLTRILGILIDNAIEAATLTKEKIVDVEISSDSKKQLFKISNSCNNNNIKIDKLFEKGYSTKEQNSGIGLWEVHNILEKNEQANLYTVVKDYIFVQQLEIFNR